MEVIVLADTHLRSGLQGLPGPLADALRQSDAIIHAGDIVSTTALEELRQLGPVYAVLGNNDVALAGLLPTELHVELAGVRLAVLHDSGAADGRAARMARRFPDAQMVVFGHSHIPIDETGIGGQLLFNPGSPTQRRAQPHRTFGRLHLEGGQVVRRAIVPLQDPSIPGSPWRSH